MKLRDRPHLKRIFTWEPLTPKSDPQVNGEMCIDAVYDRYFVNLIRAPVMCGCSNSVGNSGYQTNYRYICSPSANQAHS